MSDEPRYLLLKRGLYYRPNNQGYTGIKENAGRYTQAEGDALADCGVTAIHEDEADQFSAACYHDVARAHLKAKLAQAKAEIDRLNGALDEAMRTARDLIPGKLCGESWGLPDNETVGITVTFGALKRARVLLGEERPIRDNVASIPDEKLLERATRAARSRATRGYHYRWVAVGETFGLGSTYSMQLCRRFGLNPDERVRR